jgi:hypothetical protein
MRRALFHALMKTFRDIRLLEDSIQTSLQEQFSMFLHIVGHNQRFRVIHGTFRRSMETASHYFKVMLYSIGDLRGDMIKPPSGHTPPKI